MQSLHELDLDQLRFVSESIGDLRREVDPQVPTALSPCTGWTHCSIVVVDAGDVPGLNMLLRLLHSRRNSYLSPECHSMCRRPRCWALWAAHGRWLRT